MRNVVLHDQLRAFAERASERLADALTSGAEIPFEVSESPGATSTLYRYKPLSSRFVRERLGELRGLDGYGPALLALGAVEGLSAYLRALGSTYVPASERDRAEAVLREFLARLWEDVTSFELDERRFERTYRELEAILYENTVMNMVLAPLPNVRLPDERWELGAGLSLCRGDACQAPPEAAWGNGREGGDPATLVVLSAEGTPKEPPPLAFARLAFRKLLTALRLLKPGPAWLAPTGWWRVDDGPWQQLALGFPVRPRGGAYTLEREEKTDLIELFELVRERPLPGGALPWALGRFEMGCEQAVALEGLSDHLLALRALLDGDDSEVERVSARLAALCAEPAERSDMSSRVDRAFKLQTLLMRGEVDSQFLEAAGWEAPDALVLDVEQNLRALLRDMVCGYLEPDVKRVADEFLVDEVGEPPAGEQAFPVEDVVATEQSADEAEPSTQAPEQSAAEPEQSTAKPEPSIAEPEQSTAKSEQSTAESEESTAEHVVAPGDEAAVEADIEVTKAPPKRSKRNGGRAAAPKRPKPEPVEQPTEEAVAVGAFGESWTGDDRDWGFDDDPGDFSGAV
jgi:hypothetical protein